MYPEHSVQHSSKLCTVVQNGLGKHLYDIDYAYATDLLFWFYQCQWLWGMAVLLVKFSILCLYLRIFPDKNFRLRVYATALFMTVAYSITTPMAIVQCLPIKAAWDLGIKHKKCLSIEGVGISNAAVNLISEVIIILLPLSEIRSLQLPKRKKVPLYGLFGAGVL